MSGLPTLVGHNTEPFFEKRLFTAGGLVPHNGQIGAATYECRSRLRTRAEGKDIGRRAVPLVGNPRAEGKDIGGRAVPLVGNPVAAWSVRMQGQGEDITASSPYHNATALLRLFDDHNTGEWFDKLRWETGPLAAVGCGTVLLLCSVECAQARRRFLPFNLPSRCVSFPIPCRRA